jgi:hypothetical protein
LTGRDRQLVEKKKKKNDKTDTTTLTNSIMRLSSSTVHFRTTLLDLSLSSSAVFDTSRASVEVEEWREQFEVGLDMRMEHRQK